MQSDNKAGQGEFRILTPGEIGSAVSTFRKAMDWKQMTLAYEAGVSERTIQRLECGERVDETTLRRVAKALKLPEEAFVGPRYVPTPEEVMATAKETIENYRAVNVGPFSNVKDFDAVLGAHGSLIDDRVAADSVADDIAEFKDLLEDWSLIYGDVPYAEKLDACRGLLSKICQIEAKGYTARFGIYSTDDDFTVAVVIFLKGEGCELKQAIVPRHFARLVVAMRG